jgi:hypothetical protein
LFVFVVGAANVSTEHGRVGLGTVLGVSLGSSNSGELVGRAVVNNTLVLGAGIEDVLIGGIIVAHRVSRRFEVSP